ncbi:MAG: hypothetical protein RIS64_4228 [Bacteroidota bacterium]|jgi:hypothetical protein
MCKSVKGIGRSYGGFEPEQLVYLGGGAVISKALTTHLIKTLKIEEGATKKILKAGLPFLLGYLLLTKTQDEKMHAAGVGAMAAGALIAVEEYFPDVFNTLAGVGDTYDESVGTVIDLNSSDWSYVSEDIQSGYESVGQTESNGIH